MKKIDELVKVNVFIVVLLVFVMSKTSFGHCEIPCGIYGDSLRIELIAEHITTIEKSMTMIDHLSAQSDKPDYNQIVRWVVNKEEHANKIQEIVSQYFLHQRIKAKPVTEVEAYAKYTNQLALLHQISVAAMLSKQSTDSKHIKTLRELLTKFSHSYFHEQTHPHKH